MRDINSKHCKDICRFTGTRQIKFYIGMYERGYSYCSRCAFYFAINNARCVCCGIPLRTKPRHRKFRDEPKRY